MTDMVAFLLKYVKRFVLLKNYLYICREIKNSVMKKFDLVDKGCLLADYFHAPFETIEAETIGKTKSEYHKLYPEYPYTDILCRKHRINSFNQKPLCYP